MCLSMLHYLLRQSQIHFIIHELYRSYSLFYYFQYSKSMQGPAETDERIPNPLSDNHSESRRKIIRPAFSSFNPIRINADDQVKWKLLCYPAVVICAIITLSLIAALALPPALLPVNQQRWVQGTVVQQCRYHIYLSNSTILCASSNSNYTTSGAFVTNLVPLNQFLVLYLDILPQYYPDRGLYLDQVVNFTLYSALRSFNGTTPVLTVNGLISTHNITLNGNIDHLFPDNQFFILYMTKLNSDDQYYWQLTFANNSLIGPNTYSLNSQIVNANFSLFTIFLRVGLFIVAFAVFVKYNQMIFQLPKDKVSIQQRAIQVLSVVTLTFNDQLYFISVISPNPFSSFLSSFFLWNFVAYLFIIWALFLNRIKCSQPDTNTYLITLPISIIVFLFYGVILGYSVAYAITQTTDHPVFSFEDISSKGVIAMEIIAFIVFSLACVYIIYLFIYILKFTPRLYRHNVFMGFSAAFFISTIVFFFVGGYDLFSYSGSKILFTLSFMNMFSFFLQYLYAPTQNQLKSIHREAAPLVGDLDELIQIPDSGEVLVEILSNETEKSEKDNEKKIEEENKDEGSLSARERRKRHRKIRNLNKSREGEKGQTNSRIVNDSVEQPHVEDEFS